MALPGSRGDKLYQLARLRREVARLEKELALPEAAGRPQSPTLTGGRDVYALLDEYPDGFLSIHSADGDYVYASRSVTSMFGWEPDALIGTNAYDYFHESDLDRIASSHASHSDADPIDDRVDRVRYRLRCADGSYRWVETISRASLDGDQVEHIVCVTRDVHEAQEARERARAAEDELVRAYHARFAQRLANSLGHELASPLTSALGGVSVMRDCDPDAARDIESSLLRMRAVLRELTMLASMSSQTDVIDVSAVVARVIELSAEDGDGPPVELELAPARITSSPASVYHLVYAMLQLHTRAPEGAGSEVHVRCAADGAGVRIDMRSSTENLAEYARADLLSALRGTTERVPDIPLRLARAICEDDLRGAWSVHMDSGLLQTVAVIRSVL